MAQLAAHHGDMALNRPKNSGWFVAGICAFAVLTLLLTNFVLNIGSPISDQIAKSYSIPPTFGGHRVFYAVVLALLLSMTLLAMGATTENLRFLLTNEGSWHEPAKVSVFNETILLLVVILAVLPDAVVLLAWGENAAPSNSDLAQFDRAMDGVAAFTFLVFLWRRVRVRPVLIFQLQRDPIPLDLEPSWEQLRPKVMVAISVIVISFGVAFGK